MIVKLVLIDGTSEDYETDAANVETFSNLVRKHTERSLTGSVSYLDDVEFKAVSGRRIRLAEIRSVEE